MEKLVSNYKIKSYECDKNCNLNILSLFHFLQDCANNHAELLGVGYDFCKSQNLAWVGTNYIVNINRLPKWEENITIKTWPSAQTLVCAIRDFEIFDEKGERIITASSQWVLLNIEKMRPVKISNVAKFERLNERAINTDFHKIKPGNDFEFEKKFSVEFSDIDLNNHVNNCIYPSWAFNSLPINFLDTHKLINISVNFEKSAIYGDKIIINSLISEHSSTHKILSEDKSKEFAIVNFSWIDCIS